MNPPTLPHPLPAPLTAEAFAGNFPLFDERKGCRYRGLWILLLNKKSGGVDRGDFHRGGLGGTGQFTFSFKKRWSAMKQYFLFVFQILIYIFKLILLTINPLLLAFKILYLSEICSTPKRVKHQNSANSPKTLQNGLRRGQTTKNTTKQ